MEDEEWKTSSVCLTSKAHLFILLSKFIVDVLHHLALPEYQLVSDIRTFQDPFPPQFLDEPALLVLPSKDRVYFL